MNNDVFIIELDRPRQLKFTHSALKTLVALTGKNLEDLEGDLNGENFEMVEKLAYCGLLKDAKDHNETLTPEKVVELLDEAPVYAHLLQNIFAAWNAAFGVQKQNLEGNHPPEEKPAKGNRTTGKNPSE